MTVDLERSAELLPGIPGSLNRVSTQLLCSLHCIASPLYKTKYMTINSAVTMAEEDRATDPFLDSSALNSEELLGIDSTLLLARNASLTLGTDSLIVLGTDMAV